MTGRIGEVDEKCGGVAAQGTDVRGGPLGARPVLTGMDDQIRPRRGQFERDRPTNAARRTRDGSDLACEIAEWCNVFVHIHSAVVLGEPMNGKDPSIHEPALSLADLQNLWAGAALAFRGYNVTNLGRTPDLLAHPRYGPIVEANLERGSRAHREILDRPCDLVRRVRERRETSLDSYAEALTLIVAVSVAHLEILEQCLGLPPQRTRLSFGYSLGEITALVAGGMLTLEDALRIPLLLADDCVALAENVTLGVLFSRGAALPLDTIGEICQEVNFLGEGVIGMSAILSPNSVLLLGQGKTLDLMQDRVRERLPQRIAIRKNPDSWPPLHTPIVWQKNIVDRAGCLLHTVPIAPQAPTPPVFSLVTGQAGYSPASARGLLRRWVDEPQRLWDAVIETLATDTGLIVHLGPEPNIIPATYQRLRDNVLAETRTRFGIRALSAVVRRPWLRAFLPERTSLLRAPQIKHLILEDWLLDNG